MIAPLLVHILPEEKETEPYAVAVNGYTPELWEERGAVPLSVAMEMLRAYLSAIGYAEIGAAPLAHNAGFDRGFLNQTQKETGVDLALGRRPWRCSQASYLLAQDALLCEPASPGLHNLIAASGFPARGAHHCALEDARAALHGYRWLLSLAKKEGGAPTP
jgi:DNA polymerase III epsilon subunit-like protein